MSFIERQNRDINKIPSHIVEEIRLQSGPQVKYFSWLVKDEECGLCEEIYGAKNTSKGFFYQKIAVISEKGNYLFRNCYIGGFGGNGFYSYGYDGKGRYVQYNWLSYESDFGEGDSYPYHRCYKTELFDNSRIVELEPSLKYCSWDCRFGIPVIDYIVLYKAYPQTVEFLSKLNLYRLLTEKAVSEISKDRKLAIWISRHSKEIKNMAFQTIRNSYKKNPNASPKDYAASLQYRIESGRNCAMRNKALYSLVLKHTTQERLSDYLKDNSIEKQSYEDYIEACAWLKLDLSDTKVLFPRDFRIVHHEYTTQYGRHKEEVEKASSKSIDSLMEKTAQQFDFMEGYHMNGFVVVVARKKMDLIDEGSYLHHCVGKMDYDKRQAKGESLICFIRKETEPAIPFVTAEVKISHMNLNVVQCYGKNNHIVDEVNPFVKEWMRTANKKYKKMLCA